VRVFGVCLCGVCMWCVCVVCVYRYAPHNDVSVKDIPHIRRLSHYIII
jgi:hypothetical protein